MLALFLYCFISLIIGSLIIYLLLKFRIAWPLTIALIALMLTSVFDGRWRYHFHNYYYQYTIEKIHNNFQSQYTDIKNNENEYKKQIREYYHGDNVHGPFGSSKSKSQATLDQKSKQQSLNRFRRYYINHKDSDYQSDLRARSNLINNFQEQLNQKIR